MGEQGAKRCAGERLQRAREAEACPLRLAGTFEGGANVREHGAYDVDAGVEVFAEAAEESGYSHDEEEFAGDVCDGVGTNGDP